MIKRVIAFVDGENLVFRYQEMLAAGRKPRTEVIHEPDCFVWSNTVMEWTQMDLIRVLYYTSVTGDDARVARVRQLISSTGFRCQTGERVGGAQIIPRIHKKLANSRKSKVVDVDIAIDVVRAALTMPVDGIWILSGDGDYAPLVKEIVRTNKQVYVAAFSSGLSDELRTGAEAFVDLDGCFFS